MSENNNQNENQVAEQNGEQPTQPQADSNVEHTSQDNTANYQQEQQQQQENQKSQEAEAQAQEQQAPQNGQTNEQPAASSAETDASNQQENNNNNQIDIQQQQQQQQQYNGAQAEQQQQQPQLAPQQAVNYGPEAQQQQQAQYTIAQQPEQQQPQQPQPGQQPQQQQPEYAGQPQQQQPGMPQQQQPQPQPQPPAGQMQMPQQMGGEQTQQIAPADFDSSECKNLYVGNLDLRVDRGILHEVFSTIGTVASCKLILDKNTGKSAGYGFVEFYDHQHAEQAMATLNGKKIYESEIKINWAYTSQNREDTTNHFHIFVGDLAPDIDDRTLYQAFSAFSTISDARVLWDQTTGRSRGYGFVAFREKSDAEQAIKTMTGVWLSTKAIRCNWAHQRGPTRPDGENNVGTADYATVFYRATYGNTTVYVGNLAPEVQEKTLMTYFYRFGNIEDIRLHRDKGFGFVRFSNHESATQAIVYMNGTELMGKRIKVSWGKEKNPSMMGGGGGGYPMGGMPMGYPMPGMYPYAMPGQEQMAAYYGMQGYDPSFAAASAQSQSQQGSVGPMKRPGSASSGRFQPYSQSGQSQ